LQLRQLIGIPHPFSIPFPMHFDHETNLRDRGQNRLNQVLP
jgi:hypothetical protein